MVNSLQVISDGTFWLDGGAMFGVVPWTIWSRHAKPDEQNRVAIGTNCLLLHTGDGYALIEAGLGDVFPAERRYVMKLSPGPRLPAALAAANVDRSQVRWVILSHLHFDHAGWIAMRNPHAPEKCVPTFPNAQHVVQETELALAADPPRRMRASYLPNQWKTISEAGLWHPLRGNKTLFDGVRVEVVARHNPNLQVVLIEKDNLKVAFLSDLIPTWLHLRPAWCAAYDAEPDRLVETKRAWIKRIVAEGWTVDIYHAPVQPLGRLILNVEGEPQAQYIDKISS